MEICPGKLSAIGFHDISISLQQAREREIPPVHRMKIVMSFVDQYDRAGSFHERWRADGRVEECVCNLLRL